LLAQCEIHAPETQWLLDHLGMKAGWRALDVAVGPSESSIFFLHASAQRE
jgi:hypothetical protein